MLIFLPLYLPGAELIGLHHQTHCFLQCWEFNLGLGMLSANLTTSPVL